MRQRHRGSSVASILRVPLSWNPPPRYSKCVVRRSFQEDLQPPRDHESPRERAWIEMIQDCQDKTVGETFNVEKVVCTNAQEALRLRRLRREGFEGAPTHVRNQSMIGVYVYRSAQRAARVSTPLGLWRILHLVYFDLTGLDLAWFARKSHLGVSQLDPSSNAPGNDFDSALPNFDWDVHGRFSTEEGAASIPRCSPTL